jgi:hypothetical protein
MEQLELVRKENAVEEGNQEAIVNVTNSNEDSGQDRTQPSGRRNPPARNTSRFWFERFLAVIQRQNPSVIDSAFLKQIAPSNEGKLLAQLKFLKVIDEQGRPTDLLVALNMVGQEQKKGFQTMAREAYSDLMSEVMIEKAVPDDLVNFFIRKYAFTRDKGVYATKFFLYLVEKGSITMSPELSSFLTEKSQTSSPQLNGAAAPVKLGQSRIISQKRNGTSVVGERPLIQATINVSLDKDTPREYWDRILALLGEEREVAEPQARTNGSES